VRHVTRDSKIKPSTAVFASVCLVFRICFGIWNVSQISTCNELKKKKWVPSLRFSPARLSRYAAAQSSRRAFGTHSRASGARCLRAKTVA